VDQPIWNREDSNLVADFHAPNAGAKRPHQSRSD
jgi:hypothetical protein